MLRVGVGDLILTYPQIPSEGNYTGMFQEYF